MITILGFGDSLTAGTPGYEPAYDWGDEKSQYGYWLIKEARNGGYEDLTFRNEGVPGELAIWMPKRLQKILNHKSYDILVIMAGSNDLGWENSVHSIKTALTELWSIGHQQGCKVVACCIPPIAMRYNGIQTGQKEVNDFILESSNTDIFQTVDTFSVLSSDESLLLPEFDSGDGLHLNVEGYRRVGIEVWNKGVSIII
jgi:lysophospholipase L1-like esterase